MTRYFYHGIEGWPGTFGNSVQVMIKILSEGIIIRNQVRGYKNNDFNHVCLYKRNEEFDYDNPNNVVLSARNYWMSHGFVFVLNPEIDATKTNFEETDLVDEWRCYHNIPPSEIVAIAIPFEDINEYLKEEDLEEEDEEDRKLLVEGLVTLKNMAEQLNIPIYDSCVNNFTDELDSTTIPKR